MMEMERVNCQPLCQYCSRIDFDLLRGPTIEEINDIVCGKSRGGIFARGDDAKVEKKIDLGSLGDIRKRAARCSLCLLLLGIINRQGAVYKNGRSLDAESIFFRADPDLCYYGAISSPMRKGAGTEFIFRRLNLTAHEVQSRDAIAYFNHLIQVCAIEQSSLPDIPHHGKQSQTSKHLFGGRKRSLELDLNLVRKWMKICSQQHQTSCTKKRCPSLAKWYAC